jgi:AAA+ ATPase superfamily predicted ATPase
MIAREIQITNIQEILESQKSAFVAFTGRRRVGKTYLIDQALGKYFSFRITGIQDANTEAQIINFTEKLVEYWQKPIVTTPRNWQEAFILFRAC